MGLFKKMRANFHDDWCSQCQTEMEAVHRKLFALPMMVGHYRRHEDVAYYRQNLRAVARKADIPTGMYACGVIGYRCPECGHRAVKLDIFLPVRDQEQHEQGVYFDNGEADGLLQL